MKKMFCLVAVFFFLSAYTPITKLILVIGDSTTAGVEAEGFRYYGWLRLLLLNPPAGYRIEPAGQYSGISPPAAGDLTAAVNYVGAGISSWYDGTPSASDGCYLRSGWVGSTTGCVEMYKPTISIMQLGYNDLGKMHSVWGDSTSAVEATYIAAIDYMLSNGTIVVALTSYPLDIDSGILNTGDDDGYGAYTTTDNDTYRVNESDADWEDDLNHNYRVFVNRLRDYYASTSRFYFVDVNEWFLDNYTDPDDWCDNCLSVEACKCHIKTESCQVEYFKLVRQHISATVPELCCWHEVQ